MKRRWTTLHSLKDLHDAAEADEQAKRKDEYDRRKDRRIMRLYEQKTAQIKIELKNATFDWIAHCVGWKRTEPPEKDGR